MPVTTSLSERFKQARERAGLSIDQVAKHVGMESASIWDIESDAEELSCVYSLAAVRQFAQVLGVTPAALLGVESTGEPISGVRLVALVREHCQSRGISLSEFEDAVGWRLADILEPPERLLSEITIDGLQWLCCALAVDWQRGIIGL